MTTGSLIDVIGDDLGDAELTQRIAEGDAESLGVLFDRHHADVRRFIGRLGVAAHDVEDLVQQTFLEVLVAARRFDADKASLRTWLFGVAAMMVRRHRFSLARIARTVTARMFDESPAQEPNAVEQLATRRDVARAIAALGKLSPKKRVVFVMIVMEGARGEEVAEALGIPLGTVWTRLHHARQELQQQLKDGTP